MSQLNDPEIEYKITLTIDGEEVGVITGHSEEAVLEDWRKLDHAKDDYFERVEAEAEQRYEDYLEESAETPSHLTMTQEEFEEFEKGGLNGRG